MNLFETIQARQSIRAYAVTAIEPEKIEAILQAALLAPSAGNTQAYQSHIIESKSIQRALAHAALQQDFIAQAPVVLAFCVLPARASRYGQRGEHLYCVQDATLAAGYAQLAAVAQGLASCWIGAFDEQAVGQLLDLPPGERPIVLLPIGYAAERPTRPIRRPADDMVRRHSPQKE